MSPHRHGPLTRRAARTLACSLAAALLLACPKDEDIGGSEASAPVTGLVLPETPGLVAHLEYTGPERRYIGPARLRFKGDRAPFEVEVEDFDQAETFVFHLESEAPARFGAAEGVRGTDSGSWLREKGRLLANIERTLPDGSKAHFILTANLIPAPIAAPDKRWPAGTTLYYGRSYDDKPITKVVPMALTAKVGTVSDGSRVLKWKADLDPATQQTITGELTVSGRRLIPAALVEKGERHEDRFDRGEEVTDATSLFLSRAVLRNLQRYGGSAWHDVEVCPKGVMVRHQSLEVLVQADDAVWRIPALVGTACEGRAIYVITDDPVDPLLLSVSRPGYQMKLMAVGRPVTDPGAAKAGSGHP